MPKLIPGKYAFWIQLLPGLSLLFSWVSAFGQTNSADKIREADIAFLRDMARDVVKAAAVHAGSKVGQSPTNSAGFTLYMPGGHGGYPAFWIRDFSMSLDSGLFTAIEISNHLNFIARSQNGPSPRSLKNGLLIPPFAIPDHINFDGGAVFYPGTYSASDDQGDGSFGILPPIDDHYEFVHVAFTLFQLNRDSTFLQKQVNGLSLMARLQASFAAPETDPETDLVQTSAAKRAVGFGFCDGIILTGKLLFPSLLRYRAAGELAQMCDSCGQTEEANKFHRIQQSISRNLGPAFSGTKELNGWLLAATETGRQADVWGTLYALRLGILNSIIQERARQATLEGVRQKTIVFEGAVRHVPTNMDYSTNSAWEQTTSFAVNTYQNGAFWHTPTGWLIDALLDRDKILAAGIFEDYIHHLRQNDFRLGPGHEAPWECFHPPHYKQNGVYMTSVTLPYSLLKQRFAIDSK